MGFFAKKATKKTKGKSKSYTDVKAKSINIDTLHKLQCKACDLKKATNNSPFMEPVGTEDPILYVLGPSPRYADDQHGKPFVSTKQGGEFFRELLLEIYGAVTDKKFDLYERSVEEYSEDYFRFGNTLQCHPHGDTEGYNAIECCRQRVIADIERTKPKVIIGTGTTVLKWMIGDSDLQTWRGRIMPVQIGTHVCWFMPVYEPAFIMSKKRDLEREGKTFELEEERTLQFDTEKAIAFALENEKEPEILELDDIPGDYIYIDGSRDDDLETVEDLCEYYKGKTIAYDIETKGEGTTKARNLRPYGKDARILTISFSDGIVHTSVALDHRQNKWTEGERETVHELIGELLFNSDGKKIAHNLSFELEWTGYYHGYDKFHSIDWEDTLAAAYILDQRPKGLGLDVQARQHFGVSMKGYEKVDRANLDKEDLTKVLKYNVIDSVYTILLFNEQMKILKDEGLYDVYREQVRRIPTLVIAQLKGIDLDVERAQEFSKNIGERKAKIIQEINELDPVASFSKFYGYFNPGSDQQVGNLLGNYLGYEKVKKKNGGFTTGEEVLKNIDHPVAEKVLKYREVDKLKSTYIDPYVGYNNNVWHDSKIHTNFNHSFVKTRRLSSSNPNCFSADTEILTDKGWVYFPDLTQEEKVAQYDLNTNEIDFEYPEEYHEGYWNGDLVHITTDIQLDLLATPDHVIYLQSKDTKKWNKYTIDDFRPSMLIPQAGMYDGGNESWTEAQIALICAYQADGYSMPSGGIDWVFSKKRKTDRLRWALNKCGIEYYFRDKKNKDTVQKRISIVKGAVPKWLKDKKYFGSWILNMDRESLNLFNDDLMFWDGSWTRKNCYSSSYKANTDWAQIVSILTNKRARMRIYNAHGGADNHQVDIVNKNNSYTSNYKKEYVKYDGNVYCVTMPKGTIIVRRNGKVAITGQSQNLPARTNPWIREMFVAPKGYIFLTCDYGQIEARVAAMAADCGMIKKSLWEGWDIHMYFSERVKALYPKIMNKYKNSKNPMKALRGDVKNQITFPVLYSASGKSVAKYLNVPDKIGYAIIEEFFELMPEIKDWQEQVRNSYYQFGYIESLNGYRMYYPINYSELTNWPIQSTASDFTVNAMNKTSELAEREGVDWLHPILNIHDDIMWRVPEAELETAVDRITRIMTIDTINDFDYINVPLTVEPAIGYTWYDTKKEENELGDISSIDFGHKRAA